MGVHQTYVIVHTDYKFSSQFIRYTHAPSYNCKTFQIVVSILQRTNPDFAFIHFKCHNRGNRQDSSEISALNIHCFVINSTFVLLFCTFNLGKFGVNCERFSKISPFQRYLSLFIPIEPYLTLFTHNLNNYAVLSKHGFVKNYNYF